MNEYNYISFEFSPKQKEIFDNLSELVGQGVAQYYRDACWLMKNSKILKTTALLVAHLLREINSAFLDIFDAIINKEETASNLNLKINPEDTLIEYWTELTKILSKYAQLKNLSMPRNIEEIEVIINKDNKNKKIIEGTASILKINSQETLIKEWKDLTNKLSRYAHRKNLDLPRTIEEIEEIWEKAQNIFYEILLKLRDYYFYWFKIVDSLINKSEPNNNDVRKLKKDIPNTYAIRKYFFERLNNPKWVKLLKDDGFFKNPPEIVNEEDKIYFPRWPEIEYLRRMCENNPEWFQNNQDLVFNILKEMEETENILVQSEILEILLILPIKFLLKEENLLLHRIINWIDGPYFIEFRFPEKIADIILKLIDNGFKEAGMLLTSKLLEIKEFDSSNSHLKTKMRMYEYKKILEKYYPEIAKKVGLPALSLLCEILENAILLSSKNNEKYSEDDFSYIWREAIEKNDFNHDLKNVLVTSIRDISKILIDDEKMTLKEIIDVLNKRNYKIFKRIVLYLLSIYGDKGMELVSSYLKNKELFNDLVYYHEYSLLINKYFRYLSQKDQEEILGWIDKGSKDYEDVKKEKWQLRQLSRIGKENLPKDWQDYYQKLEEKFGEIEHPDSLVNYEFFWGPISPIKLEELEKMSLEEIISYLKKWKPSEKERLELVSSEGLGRVLSLKVRKHPEEFSSKLNEFKGMNPTYIRNIIEGLMGAIDESKVLDWESILDFFNWLVNLPRDFKYYEFNDKQLVEDPDWGWTRLSIARFLREALKKKIIPFNQNTKVWEILKILIEDPNPEFEKEKSENNLEPYIESINSVRGEALHSVIDYALWVKENNNETYNKIIPGVRKALEDHLNILKDPSFAIRSIYGERFNELFYLDKDWTINNINVIFPIEKELEEYWKVAWSTYIIFCQPKIGILNVLKDHYLRAVKKIDLIDNPQWLLKNPSVGLVEHLLIFYMLGHLELDDELFTNFWKNANKKLRSYVFKFIGQILKRNYRKNLNEIIERVKELWNIRFNTIKQAPNEHLDELKSFGWLFITDKFDISWQINQLEEVLKLTGKIEPIHDVIEKLTKVVSSFPKETVECLRYIIEGDEEGDEKKYVVIIYEKQIFEILKIAKNSKSSSEEASKMISYLISKGYTNFYDLSK